MTKQFPAAFASGSHARGPSTAVRPLEAIRQSGAGWISEVEVEWMCNRIQQLESALQTIADMRASNIAREALNATLSTKTTDRDL